MSQRAHSIWAASKAEQWFNCPGSIREIRELTGDVEHDAPSPYAMEGTAMHTVAHRALTDGRPAADYVNATVNGVWMDDEHGEAVQLYVDTILNDWLDDGGDLLFEHRFDLSNMWPGLFGTCDACQISNRLLRVYDLKGGAGVPVEVKGNLQELIYGVGAYRTLQDRYEFDQIELVIVQPRCPHRDGPVRRWRFDVVDLWDFTADLMNALSATMDPDAKLQAGPWCRWCPVKPRCGALREYALQAARMDFGGAPPMPNQMTDAEVVALLGRIETMDLFISAVRAHALQLAQAGVELPGWKLVPKRALRKWREGVTLQDMAALGLTNAQALTEPELRSPAQIEKQLPKAERPKLEAFYERVSSGFNLVPSIDHREAVADEVHRDFKVQP